MWTDYQLDGEGRSEHAFSMAVAEGRLMDHRQIAWRQLPRYESFTPLHALNEHERSREWLKGGFGKPFDGPTVVVTHHGPHPNSVHWRWKGSALNPAFSSDLTGLFWLGKPALWVHGHTHDSFDYRVGDTRVVCNPKGYHSENPLFDPALVVEV